MLSSLIFIFLLWLFHLIAFFSLANVCFASSNIKVAIVVPPSLMHFRTIALTFVLAHFTPSPPQNECLHKSFARFRFCHENEWNYLLNSLLVWGARIYIYIWIEQNVHIDANRTHYVCVCVCVWLNRSSINFIQSNIIIPISKYDTRCAHGIHLLKANLN